MHAWLNIDWQRLFVPSQSPLETMIRGTCIYLAVYAMLRVFRRQTGSLGPADLLVLILIADAAQNGMTGDYHSITDGLILIGTIMGWEYVLDWLGFKSPWMQQFLERPPLLLIKDGQVLVENLRSELMTADDLASQLRRKGVEHPREVKRCFLEGDGHLSVITFETQPQAKTEDETDPNTP